MTLRESFPYDEVLADLRAEHALLENQLLQIDRAILALVVLRNRARKPATALCDPPK